MTREEAIAVLRREIEPSVYEDEKSIAEAVDMAIEALSEPINCVKCNHYYETEDDIDVHGHCRMDTAHTMTREEAIQILSTRDAHGVLCGYTSGVTEALDMAIEALQAEPTKAVPPSLADVYKWERDVALSQLEEYGIGFAEKKRDDLLEVVRCKDCCHWYRKMNKCNRCPSISGNWGANDFCSYGERREP